MMHVQSALEPELILWQESGGSGGRVAAAALAGASASRLLAIN